MMRCIGRGLLVGLARLDRDTLEAGGTGEPAADLTGASAGGVADTGTAKVNASDDDARVKENAGAFSALELCGLLANGRAGAMCGG